MKRKTLLLQAEVLVQDARIKGFRFALDLPPVLRRLCARRMLNVIDMYDLETSENVVQATKRSMRQSLRSGNLSARSGANITALYRAISDAPDDADKFADFALYWMQSKARAW